MHPRLPSEEELLLFFLPIIANFCLHLSSEEPRTLLHVRASFRETPGLLMSFQSLPGTSLEVLWAAVRRPGQIFATLETVHVVKVVSPDWSQPRRPELAF